MKTACNLYQEQCQFPFSEITWWASTLTGKTSMQIWFSKCHHGKFHWYTYSKYYYLLSIDDYTQVIGTGIVDQFNRRQWISPTIYGGLHSYLMGILLDVMKPWNTWKRCYKNMCLTSIYPKMQERPATVVCDFVFVFNSHNLSWVHILHWLKIWSKIVVVAFLSWFYYISSFHI